MTDDTAPISPQPDGGWVLVPRTPTVRMTVDQHGIVHGQYAVIYAAMVAKAPAPSDEMVRHVAMAVRARRFQRTGRARAVADMDAPSENELDDARAALAALGVGNG